MECASHASATPRATSRSTNGGRIGSASGGLRLLYDDLSEVDTYEMSDTVGRDVLIIQGRLIDAASGVPPDAAASVATTILYPWEATIVLELRDSMNDEILTRTVDRRRMEGPIDATAVEALTVTMLRRWSRLLCARLEELPELSDL